MTSDNLSDRSIEDALRGKLGRPLRFFASLSSTNETALHWAARDAPHGALVVADHQTAGRGRWGRTWVSPRGRSLLFSLILRSAMPDRLGLATTALGVAVAEGLEASAGLDANLRWPNDVIVDGKKLAGILVETVSSRGSVDALVAGIGLNVSVAAADLPADLRPTATSIALATGKHAPDRSEILAAVLARIEHRWEKLSSDPEEVLRAATERSAVLGREVEIRFPDGSTATGTALRLASTGGLEVSMGGVHKVLESAEIVRIEAR
jgi:BirA family biotin operon repressor/biotin-[acetyl-CoA-carboxylase] ligase